MEYSFDPNKASLPNSGIFGFPYDYENSKIILLPVPWEATASYGKGQSMAPKNILECSKYIDLYDKDLENFFECGVYLEPENLQIHEWNAQACESSKLIIDAAGRESESPEFNKNLNTTNELSAHMNKFVYENCKQYLNKGKHFGLIGGEHSISLGGIQACIEKNPNMGVLQIDAHCDLINSFEGFEFSHASIMFNSITKLNLKILSQVGIRGYCKEEYDFVKANNKVQIFFDSDIKEKMALGETWDKIVSDIINSLPEEIYISIDIDGLDPIYCPNTGTPVPGGLTYSNLIYLVKKIVKSGKKIIAFDLVEVVSNNSTNMNENIAANILFQMCGWCFKSNS